MAAFGCSRDKPAVHVVQKRHTEAGTCRNEGLVAVRESVALLKRTQLRILQHGDGMGHRLDVVQEPYTCEPKGGGELSGRDTPGDVGQLGGATDDRASHTEAGRYDRGRI